MTWESKAPLLLQRCLVALLIVAAASVFRALFFGGLGRGIPFLLYFPAVTLAALYGGLSAGLVATAFSATLAYFWVQRTELLPAEFLALAIFVISGILIAGVCEALHRSHRRTAQALEKTEAINQQLLDGITERKRAEAATRQAEVIYRTLFDTLIEGFCTIEMIFDSDGKPVDYRFLEYNPAFEKQTGLKNAQGRLMRDLAPDNEERWYEIYGKIALTGEPARFENEAKALGRHFEVCAYRIGGSESRKVAILFNDITERKQADESLRKSEGRLRTLVQTIPDLIWLKDDKGTYLSCNAAFERFFGAPEAAIIGKTDYDFVAKAQADSFRANDQAAMAAGGPTTNEEWLTFARDGYRGLFQTIKTSMHNADGTLVGILGVSRDITERKQAEDGQRLQAEQLLVRNATLERFNAVAVGRELRMIELKHEVNELCGKLHEPPRHQVAKSEPAPPAEQETPA